MGIVSILLLVLAAGTQPCSSAQLRSEQFPHLRSKPFPHLRSKPFPHLRSKDIPQDIQAFFYSPICSTAQKLGLLNATDQGGEGETDALTKAAEEAVACCKDHKPGVEKCVEAAKNKYEVAAGNVSNVIALGLLGNAKAVGDILMQLVQCKWTGGAKQAADWWCSSSQAGFTKETAAKAKNLIDEKATCLKNNPNTPIMDKLVESHDPVNSAEEKEKKENEEVENAERAAANDPKAVEKLMEESEQHNVADAALKEAKGELPLKA